MIRITDTVKHLVIINVLFFVATLALKQFNLYDLLALHFLKSSSFKPWQVVTHMFMHGDLMHLLFNMLGLWMFGSALEQIWGRNKFLFFYFSAGIGAFLFSFLIHYIEFKFDISPLLNNGFEYKEIISILDDGKYDTRWLEFINQYTLDDISRIFYSSSLGASGCLMGLLVAFGLLFPNMELMMMFVPVPIRAKYFVPLMIGIDVFSGLTGFSLFGQGNIGHWAHVGGALMGFIMMLYWKKTQFNNKRWD